MHVSLSFAIYKHIVIYTFTICTDQTTNYSKKTDQFQEMDISKKLMLFNGLVKRGAFLLNRIKYSTEAASASNLNANKSSTVSPTSETNDKDKEKPVLHPMFEPYPYTHTLYKKNYLKYRKMSIAGIDHDYIYEQYERIPTVEERLKGICLIST